MALFTKNILNQIYSHFNESAANMIGLKNDNVHFAPSQVTNDVILTDSITSRNDDVSSRGPTFREHKLHRYALRVRASESRRRVISGASWYSGREPVYCFSGGSDWAQEILVLCLKQPQRRHGPRYAENRTRTTALFSKGSWKYEVLVDNIRVLVLYFGSIWF